jgi:tetratricopeptide (TPR) repeat protein
MGFLYGAIGEYDSSFKYCSKSLELRKSVGDHMCVSSSLANMGHLYFVAQDYENALDYYQQGLAYAKEHDMNPFEIHWNYLEEPTGVIYRLLKKPDSSLCYLKKAIAIDPSNKMTYVSLGELYLQEKKYDSALAIFLPPMDELRRGNDRFDLMCVLLDAGQAYLEKGDTRIAMAYIFEGTQIAYTAKTRQHVVRGYDLLSKAYESLDKMDSSNYYLHRYVTLHDSVFNSELRFDLSTYKDKLKHAQDINMLNRDKEMARKEIEILVAGLIFVTLSALIIYGSISLNRKRQKLRNDQLEQEIQMRQLESEMMKAELQQKTTQLEMEVLRAQMNPHFIFNSLNSINRFVLKNDKAQASEYLTKFSRLVRMILQNSQAPLVMLESELESLKLYLELEALRFNYHFEYRIRVADGLDISALKVPPLFIQPYVENAIWHGLMHKEEKGELEIELNQEGDYLIIRVEDNGIGRQQAAVFSAKSATRHKSVGLDITAQRINMVQNSHTGPSPVTINDLVNPDGSSAGTEVIIKMPLIYD